MDDGKKSPVYSPGYPPTDLTDQQLPLNPDEVPPDLKEIMLSGGTRKKKAAKPLSVELPSDFAINRIAERRITYGKIPSEIDTAHLQIAKPEEKRKGKKPHSNPDKLDRHFKKDLVAFQAQDIGTRITNLDNEDLENNDNVPNAEGYVERPGCFSGSYYVDEQFREPKVRAIFMSKTMLTMSVYLIPAIFWTYAMLASRELHLILAAVWGLYLTISLGLWIGIHIVGYAVRNFKICVAILIVRSLIFAHTVAAITLATERLVIYAAFDVEYVRKRNRTGRIGTSTTTAMPTRRPSGRNVTGPAGTEFLDDYVYTDPYVWVIYLFMLFVIWVATALVLVLCKKSKPNGSWLYGIGGAFTVPGFLASVWLIGFLSLGKGPKLWDITQIFAYNLLAEFTSLAVVVRWTQIFRGRLFFVAPSDYVYAALRLGF